LDPSEHKNDDMSGYEEKLKIKTQTINGIKSNSPMLMELFQALEVIEASVAHPQARKILERIAVVAENVALVATVQQNIFQRYVLKLTSVALEIGGRGMD
jgi:hypothetical protein